MSVEYRAIYTGQKELKHHGILGQKWGIRRYQNYDGTLTAEGRTRYRVNPSGKKYFVKDMQKDISSSNDPKEIKKKIDTWAKTAENYGMLNPNDKMSIYDLSKSRKQTELLSRIYNNMPSVKQESENYAKELTKNADQYRNSRIQELDKNIDIRQSFDNSEFDLYKEFGTSSRKETRNYIMNAAKAMDELEGDVGSIDKMRDVIDAYQNGFIDIKTLSKCYDAQIAEDCVDLLYWMDNPGYLREAHTDYEKYLSNKTDEERLTKMFSISNEIKHYCYSSKYFIN